MLVIKSVGAHADLIAGIPRYTMVVGPDNADMGVEVELDVATYTQLVEIANLEMSNRAQQSPTEEPVAVTSLSRQPDHGALRRQLMADREENAFAELRGLEHVSQRSLTPEEVLRSVGFIEDGEEGPNESDLLFGDQEPDPGEMSDDDDGVRQY